MITPTFIRSGTSLNTRLPSYVACYRRRTNNSPIAEPLMSNASRAATGMSTERPPVLGSGSLSLGIVSRITLSLVEVLSPAVVAAPVLASVVAPVVVPVVGPLSSPQASTASWNVASVGTISKKYEPGPSRRTFSLPLFGTVVVSVKKDS